nr:ATP-binding protein [uncultured Caldimonas sp.]
MIDLTEDALGLAPEDRLLGRGDVPAPRWHVLVADDDEDVHRATELALFGHTIEGRPLAFLHAYSAAHALQLMTEEPGICVILLDVVMERPDAGLQLVKQLRADLGRRDVRIILRTGQPGYAPEIDTVRHYDIDDYCTKSEMTNVRLFTTLTTAIRSYRLITELQQQRDELSRTNVMLETLRAHEQVQAERLLGAERELRLAQQTMEHCVAQRTRELSEAVGQLEFFNRVVSHDLRGPLGGIASISELIGTELERGNLPVVRHRLSLMESHTRRLVRLVEELFNLTRVSSGLLTHTSQPLDAVVVEAIEVLGLSVPAERLACVSVQPLPTLQIDRALMRQAFVNLIGNALKFTSHLDDPRIEVQAHRQGNEWIVAVVDNGRGFDARRAGDLFKPFARLHGGDVEGSGIGLTIVRRIVERHGGRVWAECPNGCGARFCFALPPQAAPA